MMSNKKRGTIYIGVTSDIIKRVWQHKQEITKGFTHKYKLKSLVYFEVNIDIREAIKREKRLKLWLRDWKISLIEEGNPKWNDLYDALLDPSIKSKDDNEKID
jgi:putative endonuclease